MDKNDDKHVIPMNQAVESVIYILRELNKNHENEATISGHFKVKQHKSLIGNYQFNIRLIDDNEKPEFLVQSEEDDTQ